MIRPGIIGVCKTFIDLIIGLRFVGFFICAFLGVALGAGDNRTEDKEAS